VKNSDRQDCFDEHIANIKPSHSAGLFPFSALKSAAAHQFIPPPCSFRGDGLKIILQSPATLNIDGFVMRI
jgi:hypothetical protein